MSDLLHAAQALLDNDLGFAPEIAEYGASQHDHLRTALQRRIWRSQAILLDIQAALSHEPPVTLHELLPGNAQER